MGKREREERREREKKKREIEREKGWRESTVFVVSIDLSVSRKYVGNRSNFSSKCAFCNFH